MELEEINKKIVCCATGVPLTDCKFTNGLHTDLLATWRNPVITNVLSPHPPLAMGFVHDSVMEHIANGEGSKYPLKYVVEFEGNQVIYHPVEALLRYRPEDTQYINILPNDVLFQGSPCAGDLDCLCSRCGKFIDEYEVPIRSFQEGNAEYRYHVSCLGFVSVNEDSDDWDDEEEIYYDDTEENARKIVGLQYSFERAEFCTGMERIHEYFKKHGFVFECSPLFGDDTDQIYIGKVACKPIVDCGLWGEGFILSPLRMRKIVNMHFCSYGRYYKMDMSNCSSKIPLLIIPSAF